MAFETHRLLANAGLITCRSPSPSSWDWVELVTAGFDGGRCATIKRNQQNAEKGGSDSGGDCIDDADVLRTGRTAGALGCVVIHIQDGQLPKMRPRPPAGSGEPEVAGPGLGRWGRDLATQHHHCSWASLRSLAYGLAKDCCATTALAAKATTRCWTVATDSGLPEEPDGHSAEVLQRPHLLQNVGRVRHGGARGQPSYGASLRLLRLLHP